MKKLSALLLGAALCAAAQADTVTYNFNNVEELTDIDQNGSLQFFNTSMGTLTGVSLTLRAYEHTSITLTNNSNGTVTDTKGTGFLDIAFTSSLLPLNSVLEDYLQTTGGGNDAQLTLNATTGKQTLTGHQSLTFGAFTVNKSLDIDVDSILASFAKAGGGAFGLNCSSESGVTITGGGGNISSTQSTTAGCGAEITYTYTASVSPTPNPTPEPASMALVGLGLIGVAASRRKSQQA